MTKQSLYCRLPEPLTPRSEEAHEWSTSLGLFEVVFVWVWVYVVVVGLGLFVCLLIWGFCFFIWGLVFFGCEGGWFVLVLVLWVIAVLGTKSSNTLERLL